MPNRTDRESEPSVSQTRTNLARGSPPRTFTVRWTPFATRGKTSSNSPTSQTKTPCPACATNFRNLCAPRPLSPNATLNAIRA